MTKANIFITDSDYSCDDKSFEYLLWFQPSMGWMILTEEKLFIILDSRYFDKTKSINKKNIFNILDRELEIIYIKANNIIWDIIEILWENNLEKIIFEWKIAWEYIKKIKKDVKKDVFAKHLYKVIFKISEWWFFSDKRITKNNSELEKIEKAIKIIDKTFDYITELNKYWELKWKTENQIRWIIISKIFEFWWTWESFDAIVAFGKNSAIPHHDTWETIIEDWVLLIDMWAKFGWYCSDFTRIFWVWEKNKQYEKFSEIHKIVKQAHLNAFENTISWMTGKEIDNLTRKVIEDAWYWKKYIHWTGHWVGLDIHENPYINSKSEEEIKNGMVFTIEPWIYLEWEFWIRLEDIVIMEKGKLIKYSEVEFQNIQIQKK